jgi:hypothetical protein
MIFSQYERQSYTPGKQQAKLVHMGSMVVVGKVALVQVFSDYFCFTLSISFLESCTFIHLLLTSYDFSKWRSG